MAKIPLRVYNREIENLIDRGQTEEALARCKQILQLFPKYIEAYRLLGKAYLESQRYSEAADVFQRLLSTVPDDFVAHVGMSIIKEDEGNLDGAIWHMERATEIQPSNTAVQDELRRLFSRREGMEPSRLRMTRGGLVRMYARGDLYQQAITEALAALAEDTQRLDIQVVLARMYNLTGQRVKAAEVCRDLLEKLPYCYEANLIMNEILPDTSRAEEGQVYLERACELDPYNAHLKNDQMTSGDVPDNAIMIDRLEWDPAKVVSSQPNWASNLGIKLNSQEPEGHVLPDWLASLSPIPAQPDGSTSSKGESPFIDEQNAAAMENTTENPEDSSQASEAAFPNKPSGEENLPNWMQEAGWEISNQPHNQEVSAFNFTEEEKELPEAVPATEIPEWLKPLAPVEPDMESSELEPSPEGTLEGLAWVQALASSPVEAAPEQSPLPVEAAKEEAPLATSLPVEPLVESVPPEIIEEMASPAPEEVEAPAPLEPEVQAVPISQISEPTSQPEDEIVPEPALPVESEEVPDWLKGLENSFAQPEQEPVQALLSETPVTPETPNIAGAEDQNAMIDWLEDIAIHHSAEAQTIISHPEDRISKPPSWINRLNEEGGVEEESVIPDWLQGIDEPAFPAPSQDNEPPAATTPEAVPDWLTGYQAPIPAQSEPVPEPIASIETHVSEGREPEELITSPAPFAGVEASKETAEVLRPELVEESLPDWLISLSQEPLAAEEPSSPKVEEMAEEPAAPAFTPEPVVPGIDWAAIEATPSESPVPTDQASTPFEQYALEPEATTPQKEESFDWLSAFQTTTESEVEPVVAQEPAIKEAPSLWETELTAEPQTTLQEETSPVAATSETQEDAVLPDWLKMLEEPASETLPAGLMIESAEPTQPVDLPTFEVEGPPTQPAPPEEAGTQPVAFEEILPTVEEPTVEPEIPAPIATPGVELPVELVEIAEVAETPEPVLPVESVVEESGEEIPDWLRGFEATVEAAPQEAASVQISELSIDLTEMPEQASEELTAQAELPVKPEVEVVEHQPEPQVTEEPIQPAEEPQAIPEPVEEGVEIARQFEVTEIQEIEENIVPDWVEGYLAETEKPVEEAVFPEEEVTSFENLEHKPEISQVTLPAPQPEIKVTPVAPAGEAALFMAQAALNSGNLSQALEGYNELIRSGQMLEDTIHDLRDSLYRYPVDTMIWQSLGDAYLRMNQVQDALDAYTKAEELIR